jgi:hypothetical protein
MGEALGNDVSELIAKRDRARTELRRLLALKPEPARFEPVKTGRTFRQHWKRLGTVQRNELLRSAGVSALASKDTLPPFPSTSGPMTPLDIPRAVIVTEDGPTSLSTSGTFGTCLPAWITCRNMHVTGCPPDLEVRRASGWFRPRLARHAQKTRSSPSDALVG